MKVKRALISVFDKTGIAGFAKSLASLGVEIISTGGTAKLLKKNGVDCVDIDSYTGSPEMLGGRVKTLHPKIHGGILALRGDNEHVKEAKKHDIHFIDMVVVNLYPFEDVADRKDSDEKEIIENIDIGGPSMLRSAAKNFKSVAAISLPDQYDAIIKELKSNNGELSEETLKNLAAKVFEKTSSYDRAIYSYLAGSQSSSFPRKRESNPDDLPDSININLQKINQLRYGENPHQKAAFYKIKGLPEQFNDIAEKLQGKELSYNNILDLSSAIEMTMSSKRSIVSIVKHNNPCGLAEADTIEEAYKNAVDCDRVSAYGGIIAFNKPVSAETASFVFEKINFIECIAAPDYDKGAMDIFGKRKNLRLVKISPKVAEIDYSKQFDVKRVLGGMLIQTLDHKGGRKTDFKTVTKKKPDEKTFNSLLFAWKAVKYVKSNAIVIARDTMAVGIGAGQMSRVDAVIIAAGKAGQRAVGAVLASDAFFPMADSIEEARKAGIISIIQPGGSIRDEEVIAACDKNDISMVFTGVRHFRH